MTEKNLIFASASFHPTRKNVLFNKKEIHEREKEYFLCFEQLLRVVPDSFEIYIVDNSINDSSDLFDDNFKLLLDDLNIFYTKKGINKKITNIGVEELNQLIYLSEKINFENYSKICYFTSRRFVTNPYVFEKTEALKNDVLLSNPDFIYLDGHVTVSEKKGMYNDMFFAMQSNIMLDYINFSKQRLDYLEKNMINSESNLYDFVSEYNLSKEFLKFLGFLRYDYFTRRKHSRRLKNNLKYNYHFV
tara:strand:- start:384 stop:1121 length:738 start_codon:yes stop_codon:yes gene_type:complete